MMRRVGIIAALPGELRPLTRGWLRQADGTLLLRRAGVEVIAVARGIGAARAIQAVAAMQKYGELTGLVSIGWVGGTSCGAHPGTAYAVGEVISEATGERYATAAVASPLKLITVDHFAGREEKRRLAERYAVSLVDMEAAAVAQAARELRVPFHCWKAVTDGASEDLPDFNLFLGQDRQLQMGRLMAYVAARPRYVPALLRMGRNGSSGARALATAVQQWIDRGSDANSDN